MSISQIEITNIKGIPYQLFKVQVLPNKPNLLVAPNGFGKSSLATAFASMNTKRITLADKDYYMEDTSLSPELSINVNGTRLTADNGKNEIRKSFDILVINSGLISKAKKGYQGSVSSSLEVKSIFICNIPSKFEFSYKVGEHRKSFGVNGKILLNISDLLKSPKLVRVFSGLNLARFSQKRIQQRLKSVIETINEQAGSAGDVTHWVVDNYIDELRGLELVNDVSQRLTQLNLVNTEVEGFLAAYQLLSLYSDDSKKFNAVLEWLNYTLIKAHYDNLLAAFKSSDWRWAKTIEDRKKKTLSVILPKAHQLSNGQRDIITLVVQLHKTLYDGSKKPLILVIDEVFDYLDDANLVSFQYYVTSIIETYKKRDQVIYPLILTHLDPGVFFDFCFNKHKIQINYLLSSVIGKSANTLRLIEARDNQEHVKGLLEKHWFHFHKDSYEIPADEWPNTLDADWRQSVVFHEYANGELTRYLTNKNYDSLAVCFAVRINVERLGYGLLISQEEKDKFLDTHGTNNKMDIVAKTGVDIPESYFLLGLIYNTNLHWTSGRDYVSPLVTKLNHPTIKKLISGLAIY